MGVIKGTLARGMAVDAAGGLVMPLGPNIAATGITLAGVDSYVPLIGSHLGLKFGSGDEFQVVGQWVDALLDDAQDPDLNVIEAGQTEGDYALVQDEANAEWRLVAKLTDVTVPLFEGRVDLQLKAERLVIRLRWGQNGETVVAASLQGTQANGAAVVVGIDVFAAVLGSDRKRKYSYQLPFTPTAPNGALQARRAVCVEFPIAEEVEFLRFKVPGDPQIVFPKDPLNALGSAELMDLAGPLFDDLDVSLGAPALVLEKDKAKAVWTGDSLSLSGLQLQFEKGDLKLSLTGGRISLGPSLEIESSGGNVALEFKCDEPIASLAKADKPFTVVFHKNSTWSLRIDSAGSRLEARSAGDSPVASVFAPGLALGPPELTAIGKHWTHETEEAKKRFVMDVFAGDDTETDSESTPAVTIGRGGVFLKAEARRRGINMAPLAKGAVAEGSFEVQGRSWALDASGTAQLPWFDGSEGTLRVRGGNGPGEAKAFGVTFTAHLGLEWSDPQGILTVDKTHVSVDIEWTPNHADGPWGVTGSVGGRVTLDAAGLSSDAKAWGDEVFSGTTFEFSGLSLGKLKKPEDISVPLELNRHITVSLWGVFTLTVTGIVLKHDGLGLSGAVSMQAGPVHFGGSLPMIEFLFDRGKVSIRAASETPLSISGNLTMAGGTKGQMTFGVTRAKQKQLLFGKGSLTTPTIPGISVMVIVGRFRAAGNGKWLPTVTLFAQRSGLSISVFSGVVIRSIGLGFGIYSVLRAMEKADGASPEKLLELMEQGLLPDPSNPDAWTQTARVPVSLVARLLVAPNGNTPEGDASLYVGELVASLDNRARLGIFGRLWLLTSLEDAAKKAFQDQPAIRGVMTVDAKEPSVTAAMQTLGNPKCTLEGTAQGQIAMKAFGMVQTRATFEARRDAFAFALGPTQLLNIRQGPLRINATSLLAVRVAKSEAYALGTLNFEASIEESISFDLGLIEFKIALSAGVAAEAVLYGSLGSAGLHVYGRTTVHAYVALDVDLAVKFELKIKTRFGSWTKSWSKSWSFSRRIGVTAEAEALVSSSAWGVKLTLPVRAGRSKYSVSESVSVIVPPDSMEEGDLDKVRKTVSKARALHRGDS